MPTQAGDIFRNLGYDSIDALKKTPFDPEGKDYDYKTALDGGMVPDPKTQHWGSRDPKTGQILKGRKHETFEMMVEEDWKQGYIPFKYSVDGKYYSFPKEEVFRIQASNPGLITIVYPKGK